MSHRVYDNARANAVMQRAITVLNIEEYLFKSAKESYRSVSPPLTDITCSLVHRHQMGLLLLLPSQHIDEKCSPEILYYDDDTGEEVDELKKATIQIKEKLDEMFDLWHLKFGSPEEDDQVT